MKVIARSHCKESLQGVIARSHCKESLQGVMRVIASCKEPSAWSQVQVARARSQVQLSIWGKVRHKENQLDGVPYSVMLVV